MTKPHIWSSKLSGPAILSRSSRNLVVDGGKEYPLRIGPGPKRFWSSKDADLQPPIPSVDLTTDLEVYYKFNDGPWDPAETILDSSPGGHDATVISFPIPVVAGKVSGSAADLSDSDREYARFSFSLPEGGNMAIQAWFYLTEPLPDPWVGIVGSAGRLTNNWYGLRGGIGVDSSGNLLVLNTDSMITSNYEGVIVPGSSVSLYTWTHAVVSYTHSTGVWSSMLNGVVQTPVVSERLPDSAFQFFLNHVMPRAAQGFDLGADSRLYLEDVAWWLRSLSSLEMEALWNLGSGVEIL